MFRSYGPGVNVQDNKEGLVFENNIIEENSSASQNTWGGGISLNRSGGIYQNNVIRNNTADKGGGVCILNSSSSSAKVTLINNTITGNNEGGLYIGYSDAVVINSILYNNTPPGTAIFLIMSNLEVRYSDVEDSTTWPGEGNVRINPQFQSDGYHLEYSSLLFDKGISSIEIGGVTYNCPSNNIDGDVRPFAGGVPEIGADELRTAAGTETYRTAEVTIYPNPATDEIAVSVPWPGNYMLEIFSLNGDKLLEKQITDTVTHLNISTLPWGVYVVRVQDERGMRVAKFVKQ